MYPLKKRFLGYVIFLATVLCVALLTLHARPTFSSSSFVHITGIATPAFYSNVLPLRYPTIVPVWMHFHIHPELGTYARGSFVQTGVSP